jgi:hypothetical protein
MGEENCRETISSEELFFFDRKPAALPMYEVFRKSVLAEIPEAGIEVGKTQVSFFIGHMFAAVSFTPVRKAKDRPDPFLTITFGLPRRVESTRINAAAEPRPGRWTHHVMIGTGEEIDDELPYCFIYSGVDNSNLLKYISLTPFKDKLDTDIITQIGSTVGTHIGNGAVGLIYFKK